MGGSYRVMDAPGLCAGPQCGTRRRVNLGQCQGPGWMLAAGLLFTRRDQARAAMAVYNVPGAGCPTYSGMHKPMVISRGVGGSDGYNTGRGGGGGQTPPPPLVTKLQKTVT